MEDFGFVREDAVFKQDDRFSTLHYAMVYGLFALFKVSVLLKTVKEKTSVDLTKVFG